MNNIKTKSLYSTDYVSRLAMGRSGESFFRLEDMVDKNYIMHEFRRTLYL